MVNPMPPQQPQQFVPSPYPNQQVVYMPVQQIPQQIIQPVTIIQQRQGYPMVILCFIEKKSLERTEKLTSSFTGYCV